VKNRGGVAKRQLFFVIRDVIVVHPMEIRLKCEKKIKIFMKALYSNANK